MSFPRPSSRTWSFGPFEFEADSGELRRRGRRQRLQPQAGRLLEALLLRRGEVVSRGQLRRAIWPEGVHVDHGHAIDVLVGKVRAALGDQANAPRYVETLIGRGYRFISPEREPTARALVAVLPGGGLAADRADALLAVVVSRLSRELPRAAAVVATSTSRALRAADDPRVAAAEHAIRWLVEWEFVAGESGSRLHAEIVRTADGSLVDVCPGPADNGSSEAVGRALSDAVVTAIRRELGAGATTTAPPGSSTAPVDDEALLESHHHLLQRTAESVAKAERCIERALRAAPASPAALAVLGECRILAVDLGSTPAESGYEGAREAAVRALEIEPEHPEALCVLAHVRHRFDWRWDDAEGLYRRCLASSPSMALGFHRYAEFLSQHRRHEAALRRIGQARRLDPLSMPVRAVQSWILLHAGRVDEATNVARTVVDMAPSFPLGLFCLGRALLHRGKEEEAIATLTRARTLTEDAPYVTALLAVAAARAGDRTTAMDLYDELTTANASRYLVARVALALGDREAMRRHLSAAFEDRSGWMTDLAVDPELLEARDDPAYRSLRQRMQL